MTGRGSGRHRTVVPGVGLYLHTLRALRARQLVYLPARRLQRHAPTWAAAVLPPPPVRGGVAPPPATRSASGLGACRARADAVMGARFAFLNHEEHLPSIDWTRRYVGHLWSYNLHYFDYGVDLAVTARSAGEPVYVRRFVELARGWIEGTRAGRGDGWEPYAVSARVMNWIRALRLLGSHVAPAERDLLHASLAAQLRWLERRLEFHLLGNHLLRNYAAIAVGGLYFAGQKAQRWVDTGIGGLLRQLGEQVLADGTHFERSPMYHAVVLDDLTCVAGLMQSAGQSVPPRLRETIGAMAGALTIVARRDGALHLFNDAAAGIAPSRAELLSAAEAVLGAPVRERTGVVALPAAGYYGVIDAPGGDRLLVDCGEPGPRYQPGHAHCDLLSYELDLGGVPVVVDSGVSGYDDDPLREYVRSTRAHNTISIAGREQSEMWATFRVARRATPRGAATAGDAATFRFEGAYSPFWDRTVVHSRTIGRLDGAWEIADRVDGATGAPITSFVHLHPDFAVERLEGSRVVLRSPRAAVVIDAFGADRIELTRGATDPVQGWHCPEFGIRRPAFVIELHAHAGPGRALVYRIRKAG